LCGNIFTPTSPKQKYCVTCKDEGRKIADRDRDLKRSRKENGYIEYKKVCPICGTEFFTFYSKKVYCGSDICEKKRVLINGSKCDRKRSVLRKIETVNRNIEKRDAHIKYIEEYFTERGYTVIDASDYVNSHNGVLKVLCPHQHVWETTFHNFKDNNNRCFHCYISNNYTSKIEQKVRDYFVNNYPGVRMIYNDREQIAPKELDIYFPDHKVALEICGLYWHSDTANGTRRDYHYDKMRRCHEKGIRLITIFEDEINDKFDLVVSRIKQALNIYDTKIFARKCSIQNITMQQANEFFELNHLQGKSNGLAAFGLFYEGKLVSACSVGKVTRFNANVGMTLELKRFCSDKNTIVVGAASRLFKRVMMYAHNNGYSNIKSYCDMRYANIFKPVYELLGFDLLSETKYTPHYFIHGKRFRNMSLRKTPKERSTGKTEVELRIQQGYNRIWDCGHRTYKKEVALK